VALGGLVVEHAWLVDDADHVIETTLPGHGTAYYGVAFTQDAYRECLVRSSCWCLLCEQPARAS